MLNENTLVIILEGIYKDKKGIIEVIADAPCCYGVKLRPDKPKETMPPVVWFREEELKAI